MSKKLGVLVADKNMKHTMIGLLARPGDLGFKGLSEADWDIWVHPERDPGCLQRGHDFLRRFANQYDHGLLMLDRAGCGKEGRPRERLEHDLEGELAANGWDNRAAAIVFDPELEIWVWGDLRRAAEILQWNAEPDRLRPWLAEKGFWRQGNKPEDPKGALEAVLRRAKRPRSAAIYLQLAQSVPFEGCIDPGFQKFRGALQAWFPV